MSIVRGLVAVKLEHANGIPPQDPVAPLGEVAVGTDVSRVIEAVLGPIHLRLLLTGEPVDRPFLEGIVDVGVNGVVSAPSRRRRGG